MSSTTTTTTQLGTTAQAAAAVAPSSSTIDQNQPSSSNILHAKLTHTPPRILSASGNYLHTSTHLSILDATGGAAVACIGHAHPRIKRAINAQLDTGVAYAYAPFFSTEPAELLAAKLSASTNGEMQKVFIVSSGTEAIEAALKMARQYFVELEGKDTQRKRFVARKGSYHGNTLGALAVGGHEARRAIYAPILAGEGVVSHVGACYAYRGKKAGEEDEEYGARLARELEEEFLRVGPESVCAFVAETMSGLTLGAVTPVKGYLKKVKEVCDKYGVLLVLDEVMSGMGRTGTLHAWEQEGVVPHLQTVAKGLGAGYEPIGAMLVHKDVVAVVDKGTGSFVHSQTYQGHPVACAAALEVQKVVEEEKLLENVRRLAPTLEKLLREKLEKHANVGDIRGRGFMWAIEFVKDKQTKEPFPVQDKVSARMHATGLQKGFEISVLPGGGMADGVNGDVIMLAPAYNCTGQDIELIVERTVKVVEHVLGA